MKKIVFFCFWLLMIFAFSGCFNLPDKEKAIYVDDIFLSSFDRGIAFNIVVNQNQLGFPQDNVIAIGVLILREEVESAADITADYYDYKLEYEGFEELTYFVIDDLALSDYTVPFSVRPYLVYLDAEEEKTVYASQYMTATPYALAQTEDSPFAQEIIAMVENDNFVPVTVQFDLTGGNWADDIVDFVIDGQNPDKSLTFTALNDHSGITSTVVDKSALFYQSFYKLFIKRIADTDIFRVVGADAAQNDIIRSGVDDYDYILCAHEFNEDKTALSIIKTYIENDPVGMFVVFDKEIDGYIGGPLVSSFFPFQPDENLDLTLSQAVSLPLAAKDGYYFGGWTDGNDIYTVFPRYKASQNITAVTYTAVWELYTIDDFTEYMNEIIFDITTDDLALPTAYSGYEITWESSHPDIINEEGIFFRPLVQTVVTLTATLTAPGVTEMVSFHTTVNDYKKLELPLASSYIYRNYSLVDDAFFETLDIINCAFITATGEGNLHGSRFLENVQTYIMPKAREHGCWVVVSVAPESQWTTMAASAASRRRFADNIVTLINEYGFDGVDIDWEGSVQGINFTLLMEEVYTKVKANNTNHLVTAAITGGPWQPPNYNLHESGQYIDYINMMTYSLTSSNGQYQNNLFYRSGYHNPIYKVGAALSGCSIQESVNIFVNSNNIPAAKIIVGVAFYGIKQKYENGLWKRVGSVFYDSIKKNYLGNSNYTAYFDDIAGVPYILKNDGTEFISYDDPQSIVLKCQFIYANDLGGMMYWENGTDTTGTLLAAMRTGLNK